MIRSIALIAPALLAFAAVPAQAAGSATFRLAPPAAGIDAAERDVKLFAAITTARVDDVSDDSAHAVTAGVDLQGRGIAFRAEVATDFNGGGRVAGSARALLTSTLRF